jgi:hypothetical protein
MIASINGDLSFSLISLRQAATANGIPVRMGANDPLARAHCERHLLASFKLSRPFAVHRNDKSAAFA